MASAKMSVTEKRAIFSLSSIMALRMTGLFMILPVFSLYATHLQGSTPFLLGLGLGIYGLFQALLQIPFGTMSDHFGRKPVIFIGLVIFIIGSLLAFAASNMTMMLIGRALQGAGAIGSTTLALMADLTREEQRTKSMAISGITIGFAFALAMVLGPLLTTWMHVNKLFLIAAGFGGIAISLLFTMVPTPLSSQWQRDTEPEFNAFFKLLKHPELAKLNCGIFILHALFTASFVAVPLSLLRSADLNAHSQWLIYLPTLFIAFILSLVCIGMAERKRQLKPYFLGGIAALFGAELLFWFEPTHLGWLSLALSLFFGGFTLLEAFLPSLISRTAPAARKGSAMGIYSCAQFLGIFVGGAIGGYLLQHSLAAIYLFCLTLASIWFVLALLMQAPRYLITQTWPLRDRENWQDVAAKLHVIPGIVEVTFIAEDGIAYLKMERNTQEHPDFIRLKEQLIGTTY